MYKEKTLKINNGFIITGTVNTGNIINSNVNGSITYNNYWNDIEDEIKILCDNYNKLYNNVKDIEFLKNMESAAREKSQSKLKKLINNAPAMIKAFIKELGLSLLVQLITNT